MLWVYIVKSRHCCLYIAESWGWLVMCCESLMIHCESYIRGTQARGILQALFCLTVTVFLNRTVLNVMCCSICMSSRNYLLRRGTLLFAQHDRRRISARNPCIHDHCSLSKYFACIKVFKLSRTLRPVYVKKPPTSAIQTAKCHVTN